MNIINLTRQKSLAMLAATALLLSLLWSAGPVLAAPAVPVITTPSQSTTTDPIVLTGTADANVGIQVTGGASSASATSTASGDWSVSVDLTDNALNTLSVVAIDGMGSTSAATTVDITHADPVVDTTDPVFATTTDITATTTLAAGATVNFTVTATDDTDASVTVMCTPASGSTFPVGTTTVTCTAEDDAGNTATTTFDVIVNLVAEPPAPPVDLEVTGPFCSADTTVTLTGTTDTGTTVLVVGEGATTTAVLTGVDWSADLTLGSGTTTTFQVLVLNASSTVIASSTVDIDLDSEAPVLTMIGDSTFEVEESVGVFIDPGVTVTDNLDTSVTVSSTTDLDITVDGTYTVIYTATDCAGNTDTLTRTVIVDFDDSNSGNSNNDNDNNNNDDDDNDSNNDNDNNNNDDDAGFIGGPSSFPNFPGSIIALAGTPLAVPQVLGASVAYVPGMPSTGADTSEAAKAAFLLSGIAAVGMYLAASRRQQKIS